MTKEMIISIMIIAGIIILNFITQNYLEKVFGQTASDLNILKEEIKKNESVDQKFQETLQKWKSKRKKLAYFIEHDELEKVETNMTNLKSYIEVGNNDEAIASIDEAEYILEHIKRKNTFNLENIF